MIYTAREIIKEASWRWLAGIISDMACYQHGQTARRAGMCVTQWQHRIRAHAHGSRDRKNKHVKRHIDGRTHTYRQIERRDCVVAMGSISGQCYALVDYGH